MVFRKFNLENNFYGGWECNAVVSGLDKNGQTIFFNRFRLMWKVFYLIYSNSRN
jgi:hypothetical protein